MKINQRNFRFLAPLALLVFNVSPPAALAQTVVVNFDGVDTSAAPYYVSGAPLENYLAGYGITVANAAAGTTPGS